MPTKGIVSHAVERAPQVNLATLSQLKELVAMMDARNPKLTKSYMQDFLRFRLVPKPVEGVVPSSEPQDPDAKRWAKWLEQVETACREFCPNIVNEVLELVTPFLDPNLDLEFKKVQNLPEVALRNITCPAANSVFWDEHHGDFVVFDELSPKEELAPKHNKTPIDPANKQRIDVDLWDNAFPEEVKMRTMLDSRFGHSAEKIVRVSGIYSSNLVRTRLRETGAYYYKLLGYEEEVIICRSIHFALVRAISFLIVGDVDRAVKFIPFLKQQRSGLPIVYKSLDADSQTRLHLLCANRLTSN